MEIIQPAYYEQFRCLAARCPDSCCKEWEVQVDDKTATLYRALSGPLGDRLRQVLTDDPEWGTVMTIENGRCPMWRDDGLCQIQSELGADALCATCREFPRLRHDYGTFVELGLELSCPEAARLILTAPVRPATVKQAAGGDAPEYNTDAMGILRSSREEAWALLENPQYSVPEVLALLYFWAENRQLLLDGDQPPKFQPTDCLRALKQFSGPADFSPILAFFSRLEILTPLWRQRLRAFTPGTVWPEESRNLARYFVDRYWLQAVSDFDLVSRVKFVLLSCVLIRHLGGDFISTAQLYSKEIENSAENMDALLDALYDCPIFSGEMLLNLLLTESFKNCPAF